MRVPTRKDRRVNRLLILVVATRINLVKLTAEHGAAGKTSAFAPFRHRFLTIYRPTEFFHGPIVDRAIGGAWEMTKKAERLSVGRSA
jgi:hypothetical protein